MEELVDKSNKKLIKMDPGEENSNDVEPLSGEYVLRDIMDNICQHFTIYELLQVAQVCTSWNNEALREIDKRYLQCEVFPFLHSIEISDPSFHVSKILDTMPCVTLLFPGTNYRLGEVRDEVELELDIYNVYRKQLPNTLAVVGVKVSMINEQLIHSLPLESFNDIVDSKYAPAGILGICLPKNKRFTVKQAYLLESELYFNRIEFPELMQYCQNKFKAMLDSFKPGSSDYKSVILVFVSNADGRATGFMLQILKKCYTGRSYTLWGLATDYSIYGSSTSADMIPTNNGREHDIKYIALELSGPDLESWSTVIQMTVSVDQLEHELREFRNHIHLKRCTIGFLCAPIVTSELREEIPVDFDDEELAEIVKRIFPDITFISTFGEYEDYYCGIDSINGSTDPISRMDIMSLLVLTYE